MSDGYAEVQYLPAANNIPRNFATEGTWYASSPPSSPPSSPSRRRPTTAQCGGVSRSSSTRMKIARRPSGTTTTPLGHPAQCVCRPRRLLPPPAALRETRRCWTAGMAAWRCSGPGAEEGDKFPSNKTYQDSDRDPGPLVQRRRVAVLPRLPGVLRRHRPRLHPARGVLPDLESGILRQHDHGQRQHLAIPNGRAAALPIPVPERLPVSLPDSGLPADPGRRGLGHRQRGRLPLRTGQPDRRQQQPA